MVKLEHIFTAFNLVRIKVLVKKRHRVNQIKFFVDNDILIVDVSQKDFKNDGNLYSYEHNILIDNTSVTVIKAEVIYKDNVLQSENTITINQDTTPPFYSNITSVDKGNDVVKITWEKYTNKLKFKQYNLYKKSVSILCNDLSYTFNNIVNNYEYKCIFSSNDINCISFTEQISFNIIDIYKLEIIDINDQINLYGNEVNVINNNRLLLRNAYKKGNNVVLNWVPLMDPGFIGYEVFKSYNNKDYKKVKFETDRYGTTYSETETERCFYKIKFLVKDDVAKALSWFSNIVVTDPIL
jgi:hypothetical protein